MSIEREFFFTYAAVKNWNYNFSALKDLTVSLKLKIKIMFLYNELFIVYQNDFIVLKSISTIQLYSLP